MITSTKEAFIWIVNLLNKHEIPFQISGGLAAKVYGSARPLYDIDIEMSDSGFNQILPDVKDYIVFGPRRNISDTFDVQLMRLNYNGQEIDLSGNDEKMFDKESQTWIKNNIDLSKAVTLDIFGIKVPVISKQALIAYKKRILRDVDKIDLKAICD